MSRSKDYTEWLKRGRQRSVVVRVLRKPMTASEICRAAQPINRHLQLRDVWFIMGQLKARGLAVCLNPKHVTGKLYALTEAGRRSREEACGLVSVPLARDVDWRRYAQVARAQVRRLVLLELAAATTAGGVTASALRRNLRDRHPIGLNPTIRALKELEQAGLADSHSLEGGDRRRRYALTDSGAAIARQLLR